MPAKLKFVDGVQVVFEIIHAFRNRQKVYKIVF